MDIDLEKWIENIEEISARVAILEKVAGYARHLPGCDSPVPTGVHTPCSCGWDELSAKLAHALWGKEPMREQ